MPSELIVVLANDGITHIDVISEETFITYHPIKNNQITLVSKRRLPPHYQWEDYSTTCEVTPHNKHVLAAVQRWASQNR